MQDATDNSALEAARSAFARGDWRAAHAQYDSLVERRDTLEPRDAESHGYAAVLDDGASLAPLEEAIEIHERAGQVHDAARVATDVARLHGGRGQSALAMGFGRRADRLLEDAAEGAGHAHVAVMQAFLAQMGGQLEEALKLSERAYELARKYRDVDAEALALNRRGRLLVRLGRVKEGKADLDEAMMLVRSNTMRPIAAALVYCSTIDACSDMADYERALQWTEAASAWIEKRRICGFPGVCRVHRAELMRLRGDQVGARREAREAIAVFEQFHFGANIAYAQAELGMSLLEDGDLDGAEAALATVQQLGHEPMPALAIVRLRRGDPATARALLEAALADRVQDPLGRARLLPTLVEVHLALGDESAAEAAASELERTAEAFGTVGLRASASTSRARVCLARGDGGAAVTAARAAVRQWNVVGVVNERQRGQQLLAQAYTMAGDPLSAAASVQPADRPPSELESAATLWAADATLAATSPVDVVAPALSVAHRIDEGASIDGKIDVGRAIGAGAMGVVFAGRHRMTGREVAIKVLQRGLCGDQAQCARFLREALACGRIKHVNVVDVYDAGEHLGEPYIVMELLEGESLGERMRRGPPLTLEQALNIGQQMATGLAAAHAAGVVHRDLKPDNIFLAKRDGPSPLVKVVDFGISKLSDAWHTRAGVLIGTPQYMAPEQASGSATVDERSDVHAVGAVLFEMLTGRPPYVGDGMAAVLLAIAQGAPANLADLRGDLPPSVIDAVTRAIERDPASRTASASALADELQQALDGLA